MTDKQMTELENSIEKVEQRIQSLNPYRNTVIEEIAKEIEKMKGFGPDTINSFCIHIRGMKQ